MRLMRRASACIVVVALSAAPGIVLESGTPRASGAPQQDSRINLAGEIEIARLIDLSAERLGLAIDYDAQQLRAAKVTLRLRDSITDDELWRIANELLAARGFAIVQAPGSELFSVQKLTDAQRGARIEEEGALDRARAGFVMVLTELEHRDPKKVVEILRPLLSKPGGAVEALGDTDLLLISDRKPRVDQILELLERIDLPLDEIVVETVVLETLPGAQLAALVKTVANALSTVSGIKLSGQVVQVPEVDAVVLVCPPGEAPQWRSLIEQLDRRIGEATIEVVELTYVGAEELKSLVETMNQAVERSGGAAPRGEVLALPDGRTVAIVAPAESHPAWEELITRFDRRRPLVTLTYTPQLFGLGEVAGLIEETARDVSPRGSGDGWRIVSDTLSGSLIITATEDEHLAISRLLERIDQAPEAVRRPVRTFPVRNRGIREIVDVLQRLVEAGVLEGASIGIAGAGEERRGRLDQRTSRDVLPVGGAESVMIGGTESGRREQGAGAPGGGAARRAGIEGERGVGVGAGAGAQPITTSAGADPSTAELIITADEGTSTIIAVGETHRLAQLESLLEVIDVRQPQVMVEVLLVNLTDSDARDLGVELQKLEISGETLISLSSLFGLGVPGLSVPDDPTTDLGSGFTGLVLRPGDFRILIRALETLNEGRALNVPRILVSNNDQATFDSLLQQPFSSVNASQTVSTTSFGGTQDAGTSITVVPQIAAGDHLVLEYGVAISTFVGESADPALPPPRQQNQLQSVVTIPDGYTVVVGGLESMTEFESVSQVPILGDIPIIGEAFKNRSMSVTQSKFYVFIRASIFRHGGFEDLKYLSDQDVAAAEIDYGWPEVVPQVIR